MEELIKRLPPKDRKFVVGYGMDAGSKYRNLPNIVYIES